MCTLFIFVYANVTHDVGGASCTCICPNIFMSELNIMATHKQHVFFLFSSRYLSSSQTNLTQIVPPTNGSKHLLQPPSRPTPISSSNESTDYSSSGAGHGSSNGTTGVSGSSVASASSPFASPKASRRRGVNSSRCVILE